MKISSIVLAAVSGTALAAPAETKSTTFEILSLRSGSPIQYSEVAANGESFWIGKPTSSFCPNEKKLHCPPGKITAFVPYKDQVIMASEVEQQVYIDPADGALKFSVAHGSPPANAILGGFEYSKSRQNYLSHKGGFYACPVSDGIYKIFVGIKSFKRNDCLGFETLKEPYAGKGAAAFQYD